MCAGIWLLAFSAYLPAYWYDYDVHAGYVWDDEDHFLNDHLVAAGDGWWRIWLDPEPGIVGVPGAAAVWNYWPLTRSSFWLDRHLWGVDASGRPDLFASHVGNVALHALNATLFFLVLHRLGAPGASGAALAGLLFAVHPVTVESVAWLSERKNLLSGAWLLLALICWLRFQEDGRARWYLLTGLAFLLALMAKSSTVMFPVLLAALHGYQGRPWTSRDVSRLAPFFAMALVSGVTSIVFERAFIGSTHAALVAGPGERIAAAGRAIWFYLAKTLFPLDLSFNYPRWSIDPVAPASYLGAAAALLAAGVLWRLSRGPARGAALALLCFVALLLPVLGFFNVYGMRYAHVADHWQYLALMPLLALVAGLLARAGEALGGRLGPLPGQALAAALGALLVAACAGLTWQQAGAYVDADTLWRHTLLRRPDSPLANNSIGNALLRQRRYQEAIAHFERAARSETSPEPWVNLGIAERAASGDARRALPYWERALSIDPQEPHALRFVAELELRRGRDEAAEALLVRALEAHPTFAPALDLLARLYARQGRPDAVRPFVVRAHEPTFDLGARGRRLMRTIWSSLALALAGCAWVAWRESRSPGLQGSRIA